MKTVTHYICEICGNKAEDKSFIERCEAKLAPEEYPIGCIYGDNRPNAFYKDMIFAIAKNRIDGHMNHIGAWACRDNIHGDSVGDETCQGGCDKLEDKEANVDRTMSAFKRMVRHLISENIKPTIWDGKKAVPLTKEEIEDTMSTDGNDLLQELVNEY